MDSKKNLKICTCLKKVMTKTTKKSNKWGLDLEVNIFVNVYECERDRWAMLGLCQ